MSSWMKLGVCLAGASALLFPVDAQESAAQKPLPELSLKDIRYLPRALKEIGEGKGYVLYFHESTCEKAAGFVPDLVKLEAEYLPKEMRFAAINTGSDDSIRQMAYHMLVNNATFPVLKDVDGELTARLGVTTLPTAVLLDASYQPVYQGTPDQLAAALGAYTSGAPLPASAPVSDGCAISTKVSTPIAEPITYSAHIAPFLNKNCVQCHHEGGGAPMALTSYKRVSGNAEMLAEVVGEGRMPPWYAHPDFGTFRDAPQITEQEREMFAHWVNQGLPEGDPAAVPPVPQFDPDAWTTEPDVIVEATQVSAVPAKGYVPYQYIFIPFTAAEDTYVQAIEIKPTNPKVVHHANLIYVRDGFNVDESKDFLTGYVPGGIPSVVDGDRAWFIAKGSTLCFQVHLVTTGKKESNRMRVGLRFARGVVNKQIRYFNLDGGKRFVIPANDRAWELRDSDVLTDDVTGEGMFCHRIQDTPASKNNAQLYCTGTVNCEFERWNQIKIVDADNHRVSREAIREKVVRLKRDDLNEANALFLSVPAGQHELVIRFYPVSVDRAETLHVIHRFKPAERYTFRMFRARSRHQGSLLNMSAPDPLCVDLKQNQRTIRRFCKPYNVLNGLGEFVEQKL